MYLCAAPRPQKLKRLTSPPNHATLHQHPRRRKWKTIETNKHRPARWDRRPLASEPRPAWTAVSSSAPWEGRLPPPLFGKAEAAEGANQSTTPPPVLYQDSFGNIGPADPAALAAEIVPPPVPSQDSPDSSGTTFVNPNYPNYTQPNILMIMVDQMGTPRWLPQGGPTAIDNLLHNLRDLRNQSCVLLNFCGAATACTPDRATLLTGLYSQQTYIFTTLENSGEPELIPYTGPIPPDPTSVGFPTIGNVLSQKLPIGTTGNTSQGYDTVWIGKWHLSAIGTGPNNTCTSSGSGGPTAYGFNDISYCIPNTRTCKC